MRISDWSSDVCSSDLLVRLTPHGFGLRLDAGDTIETGDRTVKDPQRTLDFDRDIDVARRIDDVRSEEHTSELQSLMRISYAVFCLKTKNLKSALLQWLIQRY